ncbi:MAG: hypothetical protein FH756_02365 [Firmicutes bacterium]|nr:hypothetical protein [Bacillota bacterium]
MREDGLPQIEALVQYYFALSREELDKLGDDEFLDMAAQAYFYEDRRAVATQRGVLMAFAELAKG